MATSVPREPGPACRWERFDAKRRPGWPVMDCWPWAMLRTSSLVRCTRSSRQIGSGPHHDRRPRIEPSLQLWRRSRGELVACTGSARYACFFPRVMWDRKPRCGCLRLTGSAIGLARTRRHEEEHGGLGHPRQQGGGATVLRDLTRTCPPGSHHLLVIARSPRSTSLRFTVGVVTPRSCVGFEGELARPSAGSRPLHSAPASRPFGVLVRAAPSGALDGAALETTGATLPDALLVLHELGVMASVISSRWCGVGWVQTAAALGDQRAAGRDEQVGLSSRLGDPPVVSSVVVPGAFVLHERREETCGHLLGERHGDRVGSWRSGPSLRARAVPVNPAWKLPGTPSHALIIVPPRWFHQGSSREVQIRLFAAREHGHSTCGVSVRESKDMGGWHR
jgi:hypothetical protein